MEIACETVDNNNSTIEADVLPHRPVQQEDNKGSTISTNVGGNANTSGGQQQQQQKTKRKHRRGKPRAKDSNKPYKKSNWKFQIPRVNYKGGGCGNNSNGSRAKLARSRSLVPYNTNKFLMEEHLAEVTSALLTPSGRTRDSSFSVDSDDNYFYSLPEDEEEFLSKEFANVYEKARVERLESLTKQQLIEECLQIEDRYSSDQGTQRQQQLNVQRISAEFIAKIRMLEDKVRELSRENYDLRCQLMRSVAMAATVASAASPPSAAAPTASACQPTPMDSSSQDSESDSSSSSSTSSSSSSSSNAADDIGDDNRNHRQHRHHHRGRRRVEIRNAQPENGRMDERRRSASSSKSSQSGEYNTSVASRENNPIELQDEGEQLLDGEMEEDNSNLSANGFINPSYLDTTANEVVSQAVIQDITLPLAASSSSSSASTPSSPLAAVACTIMQQTPP